MNIIEYENIIINQVMIMAMLIIIGFMLTKFKKMSKTTVDELTFVVFRIITPCVIVNSILNVNFTVEYLNQILTVTIFAIISHLLGFLVGFIFFKVSDIKKRAVYRFACLISNAGFIGLPLAQAVLNSEGVLLVSIYVIVLNVFVWTMGKAVFPQKTKTSLSKILLNPGIIGVVAGALALLIKQLYMPEIFSSTISMISALNAPIAMIITGHYLVNTDVKKVLSNINNWLVIFLRHFAMPILLIIVFHYIFGASETVLTSAILPVASPCGVMVIMFAASFGGDEKAASGMTALSTVLSIISLPIILILCKII